MEEGKAGAKLIRSRRRHEHALDADSGDRSIKLAKATHRLLVRDGHESADGRFREAPDAELVSRLRQGDPEAFVIVHDRYRRQALSVARQTCRQPEIAEDVVQQAFLDVWRGAGELDASRGTLKSWIMAIVRHRAIDAHRRRAVTGRLTTRSADGREAPARDQVVEAVHQRADAMRLRGALRGLPSAQYEAITLAYGCELTHTEIAELIGVPVGTVKGRIRLGLAKLRSALDADASAFSD